MLVGHLAVVGRTVRRELDVGLRRGHLPGVAEASTARRLCWPRAVPICPGEAPITAAGMWSKEFWPHGREAQSMAFFSAPGIERLYSGVTNSTASDAGDRVLQRLAPGG